MNDGWQRPADGPEPTHRQVEASIEVPLTGDGPLSSPSESARSAPPPNWRKVVGLASLGGIALGVLTSVVLIGVVWNDDDPSGGIAGDPATTIDGLDPSTLITTPPTLATLEPAPDAASTRPPTGSPLPARDGSLLDEIAVPNYPLAEPGIPIATGSFDLAAAVDRLGTDVARRSSTTLELGVGGYRRLYSIVRDPTADRYGAILDQLAAVVDEQAGTTYLDVSSPDAAQWIRSDNQRVAASFDVESVGVLFQRLLLGPVRSDTISAARVSPGQLVVLDDGLTTARAFVVELPGELVPEWQLYAFGPTDEFLPSDRPGRLEYTVYVDERNEIRRVVGLSDLGGIPQLIVHDIEILADPVPVNLPDPALIEVDPTSAPDSDDAGAAP